MHIAQGIIPPGLTVIKRLFLTFFFCIMVGFPALFVIILLFITLRIKHHFCRATH